MNRLVILILLAPAFATAADSLCLETQCQLFITAGSMTADGENANFSTSGSGFITSGGFNFVVNGAEAGPFGFAGGKGPLSPGDSYSLSFFEGCGDGYFMGGTWNGVPLDSNPHQDVCGNGEFDTPKFTITGAGTFTAPFTFSALAFPPGGHCPPTCGSVREHGGGIVTFDVLPFPNEPGGFYVDSGMFTFKAPEPSTASLLLGGIAALTVLGWRRRGRAGVA